MKKRLELLAPGGDIQSIKAAILGGADAIYCGLDRFNARNRAKNITFDDLHGILRLAHEHECKIFLTMNIIIVESEIPALIALLNKLVTTSLDGIIVQDLGLLYLLKNHFPSLEVHASTQLTTHNAGQIAFLHQLNAGRVNLCRELNLDEIGELSAVAHHHDMEVEVFVHGSNCISFSGACYISSLQSGNSGNRGRCSQNCRNEFVETPAGKSFPLNMKDNSAFSNIDELIKAGADSLKIEGRIKSHDYVYSVVDAYRKKIDGSDGGRDVLTTVFNRDLNNGYLTDGIGKNMFIDNPRDNSARNRALSRGDDSKESVDRARDDINRERAVITDDLTYKMFKLNERNASVGIWVSGRAGQIITVRVETLTSSYVVKSTSKLRSDPKNGNVTLDSLKNRFDAIETIGYRIEHMDTTKLSSNLSLPSRELTALKKDVLAKLGGPNYSRKPVEIPKLRYTAPSVSSRLSILISSLDDLGRDLLSDDYEYFIQLPSDLSNDGNKLGELCREKNMTPCFPAILIGHEYTDAVSFLEKNQPQRIVTDNSGIAFEAYKRGIDWIAGPGFNLANSYSLLCLKEEFNCVGAFISNELNRNQIGAVKKPENFQLYYSIYHPITLMTSRQCLFQQITGCDKDVVDETCIPHCNRTTRLRDKNSSLIVEKSPGNYCRIFNDTHFMNTDIISDIPNRFDSFMIDLRSIVTDTAVDCRKVDIIHLFDQTITGDTTALEELSQKITNTNLVQYKKGV